MRFVALSGELDPGSPFSTVLIRNALSDEGKGDDASHQTAEGETDSAIRNLLQSNKEDDHGGMSIKKRALFPSEPAVKW